MLETGARGARRVRKSAVRSHARPGRDAIAIRSTLCHLMPDWSRQNWMARRGIPVTARVRESFPSSMAAIGPLSPIIAADESCSIAERPRTYMLVVIRLCETVSVHGFVLDDARPASIPQRVCIQGRG